MKATGNNIRLAGQENGRVMGRDKMSAEIRDIQKLLWNHGEVFLPDVGHVNRLQDLINDDRLLVVEKVQGSRKTIVGCIAWEKHVLPSVDPETGHDVYVCVVMLRLLVVDESVDSRGEIAWHLVLEGQLRATLRSFFDSEEQPVVSATFGIAKDSNQRLLHWAMKRSDHGSVRIVHQNHWLVREEEILSHFSRQATQLHQKYKQEGFVSFVIPGRQNLFGAVYARLMPPFFPNPLSGLRIRIDTADPCEHRIAAMVGLVAHKDSDAMAELGLVGDKYKTLWGPSPSASMIKPIAARKDKKKRKK